MIGIDSSVNKLNQSLLQENLLRKEQKKNTGFVASQATSGLGSGVLSVDKTQQILQKEIIGKLEERLKAEGIDLKGLDANDYTPEKVSDRILSFVRAGVAMGENDEQRASLLQAARKGVEQGFKEARDILESLNVLNGKVKEDIDKTYELIQQGLDQIANPDARQDVGIIDSEMAIQDQGSERRQTRVEIFTRDGDKVTIELQRQSSYSSGGSYRSNADGSSFTAGYRSHQYTEVNYQVDGNLDKQEQAAIDDLIKQLNGVAKDFYQGDVAQAVQKASEIGFNTDELARFSVDMQYDRKRATAAGSYQAVQNEQKGDSDQELKFKQDFVNQVTQFMGRMNELLKNSAYDFMNDKTHSISDLLKASLNLQDKPEKQEDRDKQDKTIDDITNALVKVSTQES